MRVGTCASDAIAEKAVHWLGKLAASVLQDIEATQTLAETVALNLSIKLWPGHACCIL